MNVFWVVFVISELHCAHDVCMMGGVVPVAGAGTGADITAVGAGAGAGASAGAGTGASAGAGAGDCDTTPGAIPPTGAVAGTSTEPGLTAADILQNLLRFMICTYTYTHRAHRAYLRPALPEATTKKLILSA